MFDFQSPFAKPTLGVAGRGMEQNPQQPKRGFMGRMGQMGTGMRAQPPMQPPMMPGQSMGGGFNMPSMGSGASQPDQMTPMPQQAISNIWQRLMGGQNQSAPFNLGDFTGGNSGVAGGMRNRFPGIQF